MHASTLATTNVLLAISGGTFQLLTEEKLNMSKRRWKKSKESENKVKEIVNKINNFFSIENNFHLSPITFRLYENWQPLKTTENCSLQHIDAFI
jgi:hypothetical protein